MLSQRSRPLHEGRVARRLVGAVVLSAATALAGCSALGSSEGAASGPPRISPPPQSEIAAAMINDKPEALMRLNACELLDLTPARVIALTGADMPEVQPTGSGDLDMLCTYGGPGSPERYEAELEAEEAAEASTGAATGTDAIATAETTEPAEASETAETEATGTQTSAAGPAEAVSTASSTTPTSAPTPASPTGPSAAELGIIPDTFAAGVVKPRGGAGPALGGQPVMLGSRYSCSEIRGEEAETIEGAGPGVPEAPAPARPDLETAYIDCIAAPTGGGVEAHTIFVADNDLWHITLIRPGTPRSPEADAEALTGLHRVAEHVLD